jgi:ParB family transcriptional regulator, chromosome partitioning protein
MMSKDDVVFDEKSGISVEEQQEILSKINGIAEKNRKLLSQTTQVDNGKIVINAQKSGAGFPLAVNIAAAVILLIGVFFMFFFYGKKDSQVRIGKAVYDIAERTLIEEIRKDTSEKIAEKEMEITTITTRLEEVDDELSKLYSSNQELTKEQIATQERLLALQNSFREELAVLQEERSQILEASRSREARLRAQLDERAREYAAAQQKVTGELDYANSELDKLTTEQERIAAIDAQVSGGLASAKDYISSGQYDQASRVVENLRHFCNTNTLASSRVFQSRRDFYNQSIDFVEAMIIDAQKNSGSSLGSQQFDLQAKNVQQQEKINELQKTIDTLSKGGSEVTKKIGELQASINEKDDKISSLEADKTKSAADITRLQNSITSKDQDITRLRNQLNTIQQALKDPADE